MGRGKLKMELINNEKSRFLTYRKRLKGMEKKAYEFTTLCGVEACMIIYGPKLKGDSTSNLTIWPSEAGAKAVIDKYRTSTMASGVKSKKAFDLVDYFAVRQRMVNEEITKVQKANSEAKFPSRNNEIINNLTLDQFRVLLPKIEAKIEAAKRKMEESKRDWQLETYRSELVPKFSNFQEFELVKNEFNTQLVPYNETTISNHHQKFMCDVNPLLMQYGEMNPGASSNDNGIVHNGMNPFFAGSRCNDFQTAVGMFDNNEVMNNHWVVPVPVQFYQQQPLLQPLPVQYQAASYNLTPFGEYYSGIKDFETKSKKLQMRRF